MLNIPQLNITPPSNWKIILSYNYINSALPIHVVKSSSLLVGANSIIILFNNTQKDYVFILKKRLCTYIPYIVILICMPIISSCVIYLSILQLLAKDQSMTISIKKLQNVYILWTDFIKKLQFSSRNLVRHCAHIQRVKDWFLRKAKSPMPTYPEIYYIFF